MVRKLRFVLNFELKLLSDFGTDGVETLQDSLFTIELSENA
jgi:hypothetical protein